MSGKKKIKNNLKQSFGRALNKISSSVIPFACYCNEKTIITKNGEIMQTVAIVCGDNNANLNGILSDNIREAIKLSIDGKYDEYAFWVHSIKIDDETIDNIKLNEVGNVLYHLIKMEWNDHQDTFDRYMIITFVTFVHTSMSLKMNASNFMLFLNKTLLYKIHNNWVKKNTATLTNVVDNFMLQLKQYSTKRLEISKTENGYNAEHLDFFDRIINFSDNTYGVPIVNLSDILNNSLYKFDISTIIVKNSSVKKYCAFFTLKDNNNISSILVSDIVSKLKNIIMFEIFHFENISNIKARYQAQLSQIKKKTISEEMIPIAGLDCLTNIGEDDELFCKYYGGLVLIADSEENLLEEMKNMSNICSDNGIVFGCEDVGIERTFYSLMPGNFNYIGHYNLIPFKDTLSLVNSHKMDNDNIEHYINKKALFILPTLKKYPYAFGVLKKKPDILICGSQYNEAKNFFIKMLISFLSSEYNKICIIDNTNSFKPFVEMSEGLYYAVDTMKNEINNASFSPFTLKDSDGIAKNEVIVNMISMMVLSMGGKLTKEYINIITNNIDNIDSIESVVKLLPEMKKPLYAWHKKGKLSFLFDSKNDVIEKGFLSDNKSIMCFNLSEKMMSSRQMRALNTYYIMLKFISVADPKNRNLMVINNPVMLMDHHIFELNLGLLQEVAIKKNITFLYTNNDSGECLSSQKTNISIKSFLYNSNTQIHFGGTTVNEKYTELYGLTSAEVYAIDNIKSNLSNIILKQNGVTIPLSTSVSFFDEQIIDILRGGTSIQNKIKKIIEDTKTDYPANILKSLFTKNIIENFSLTEEQELRAEKEKTANLGKQILNIA